MQPARRRGLNVSIPGYATPVTLTTTPPQKVVGQLQQLNYAALENGRAYVLGVAFRY